MRWIVMTLALVIGFFLLSVDQRSDDTGIEVALIVASALGLALAAPRATIAIALAIGLPIAALNGGVAALIFSSVGAGIGYVVRRGAAV